MTSRLTARPTATGEQQLASINHLPRPRVGANVRHQYAHPLCSISAAAITWPCSRIRNDTDGANRCVCGGA